jgi:hypothetical protein
MIELRDVADDCNSVIIDILKNRLPKVVELLELPKDSSDFQYFIKQIELDEESGFVKVVFRPDFNYRDYVWYFRAGLDD